MPWRRSGGRADVVVTIGEQNDIASLGCQPANVHVEHWLPLPLLLLPQGADQFDNAAACARAGVAPVLALQQPPRTGGAR